MYGRKLLSWSEAIKKKVKVNPVTELHKQVFNNKTTRDEEYDNTIEGIAEEQLFGIKEKIKAELLKDQVNLSNENIRGISAEAIGDLLRSSPCVDLNLSHNHIRDEDLLKLTRHLHYKGTKLRNLNLSNNRIGIEGAKSLADILVHNKSLLRLNLDTNSITGTGAENLAKAMSTNRHLMYLSLNWNNLRIFAEDFYLTLARNRTLVTLEMGYCGLKDCVASALAAGLTNNRTLEELVLFGNQITDKGANKLCEAMRKNQTLSYLNLENNLVTDSSGFNFLNLIQDKAVRRLELYVKLQNNQISEELKEDLALIRSKQGRKRTEVSTASEEFEEVSDSHSQYCKRLNTEVMFYNNKFVNFETASVDSECSGSYFEGNYHDDEKSDNESDSDYESETQS